MACTV